MKFNDSTGGSGRTKLTSSTNDFICYGPPSQVSAEYPRAAKVVTLSLQILQNCLMLINTILVERAIERDGLWERLKCRRSSCVDALTPLFYGHINPYGQFRSTWRSPHFGRA
jgi:Tn3 transposase DDE domain